MRATSRSIMPAPCVASISSAAPWARSAAAMRSMSSAAPSDQCTLEIEASETGAPGRAMAASTAAVQSPSAGRCTVSTVKPWAGARAVHSSTGRGVVVLEHQHAGARRRREQLARRGDAVGDRGDQRDILRRRTDQRGGGGARAFVLARGEAGVDLPGPALAGHAIAAGLLHRERQRRPGGGVEPGDVARDIEQGALGGEHSGQSLTGRTRSLGQQRPQQKRSVNAGIPGCCPLSHLHGAPHRTKQPDANHRRRTCRRVFGLNGTNSSRFLPLVSGRSLRFASSGRRCVAFHLPVEAMARLAGGSSERGRQDV